MNRPSDRASTDTACLASIAGPRSGPIAMLVASPIREVTAAAADSAANGSMLS